MDKLNKRIFIILFLLLAAGLAGMGILRMQTNRSNTPERSAKSSAAKNENPEKSADVMVTPKDNTSVPATENSLSWTETPCNQTLLPPNSPTNLTCREGEAGFCAFYENGRPYFCRTKNAQTEYLLNRWGSSITVTQKTVLEQPLFEHYYADGNLARATNYDEKNNLITKIWFDGKESFRLTQTDNNGRVLNKYYFTPGKPYVRYPDGNDMGETNGPWELKYGTIFTDGKLFYTLPAQTAAPDVCQIFDGYCPLPKEPGRETLPPDASFPSKATGNRQ